jgi:hypothetical protein
MLSVTISASKSFGGVVLHAEFQRDTGRLRILEGEVVIVERWPPHSWFAIASIAGHSTSGPRPSQKDLSLLLDDYKSRQAGAGISGYGLW